MQHMRALTHCGQFSDPLENVRTSPKAPEVIQHLRTYVRNAIVNPNNISYSVINTSKPLFIERVGSIPGAMTFLTDVVGFEWGGGENCVHLPPLEAKPTRERVGHLIQCYLQLESVRREIGSARLITTVHEVRFAPGKPSPNPWFLSFSTHLDGVWSETPLPQTLGPVHIDTATGINLSATAAGTTHGVNVAPLSFLELHSGSRNAIDLRNPKTKALFASIIVTFEFSLGAPEGPLQEEEADQIRRALFADFALAIKRESEDSVQRS